MSIKVSLMQSWRALVIAGLVSSLAACKKPASDEGLSPEVLGIPQLNAASRINGEDKPPSSLSGFPLPRE